jgi:predicted aspartyl protease
MSARKKSGVRKSKLISFDLQVKGSKISLRALLDTGATNNFISRNVLKEMGISPKRSPSHKEIRVRLANGSIVQVSLYIVKLHLDYGPYASVDEYVVLDLDDHMDVVLGMPWLETNEPERNLRLQRFLYVV